MNIYLRLLKFAKPYTKRIIIAALCMLVVSICTVIPLWLIKYVFDKIFVNPNKEEAIYMVIVLPLAILLAFFIKGLARYAQDYLMNNAGHRMIMDLRNRLFSHFQKLSLDFYTSTKTGHLISRIINDVNIVQSAISSVFGNIIGNGFTIIGLVGFLFYTNWRLTIISMVVLPFVFYLIYQWGKMLRKISTLTQRKVADVTSLLHENFTGIRVVKAFNMEKEETENFKKEIREYFDLSMKDLKINAMSRPIIEFIGAFGIAYIVFYCATEVMSGVSTVGGFVSFFGALFSLYQPIQGLNGINTTIQQGISAGTRVFEIMDLEPSIKDSPDACDLQKISKEIYFNNVSFYYHPEKFVLKDIDLKVKAGEMVAFVGRSGAGKSTLVDLIPRFYDPIKGSMEIDGIDIKKVKLHSLRMQIGIVTQETILFNDTVKNNIVYGKRDATYEEIIASAKASNAHNFIEALPHKYDTNIGERGLKFSGGERQRIAIARAILKNPAILILDEATSALDSESEILVQQALNNLMAGRTTFVIAHRLSTCIRADKLVVIEEGRIAGVGKHEELLSTNSAYQKLYNLQFKHSDEVSSSR